MQVRVTRVCLFPRRAGLGSSRASRSAREARCPSTCSSWCLGAREAGAGGVAVLEGRHALGHRAREDQRLLRADADAAGAPRAVVLGPAARPGGRAHRCCSSPSRGSPRWGPWASGWPTPWDPPWRWSSPWGGPRCWAYSPPGAQHVTSRRRTSSAESPLPLGEGAGEGSGPKPCPSEWTRVAHPRGRGRSKNSAPRFEPFSHSSRASATIHLVRALHRRSPKFLAGESGAQATELRCSGAEPFSASVLRCPIGSRTAQGSARGPVRCRVRLREVWRQAQGAWRT